MNIAGIVFRFRLGHEGAIPSLATNLIFQITSFLCLNRLTRLLRHRYSTIHANG